jgi:SAM-dependent methyltransferase
MHPTKFPSWLADLEPQIPLASLVEKINNLYHSFEAAYYDREHPEIFDVLPALWEEMIQEVPPRRSWRILDFGCGTGFEASQIMRCLDGRVEKLVCYDPSPEMLAQCRARLKGPDSVLFCAQLEEAESLGPFDLLLTNSLLHHLPNIGETINALLPNLTPDAMWLAGHEPSARFYRSVECLRLLDQYKQYYQRAKFLDPGSYVAKMRLKLGRDPLRATAKAALQRGWFKKLPSCLVIDRIVDFHVAHCSAEAADGRGLDFEQMQVEFASEWSLTWVKTYSFFGSFKLTGIPSRWMKRGKELAEKFPNDGANFCAVWSRKAQRESAGPS